MQSGCLTRPLGKHLEAVGRSWAVLDDLQDKYVEAHDERAPGYLHDS